MNDYGIYATGWYSISPVFAVWGNCPLRLAAIKARREAAKVVEENKQKEKINSEKLAKGTISVYA